MEHELGPAATAKHFGISIKALRLYEERGLLKPLRGANGRTGSAWRVYGSHQFVRLHQILALKRLGLSLGQIAELLVDETALDPILAVHERILTMDGERIGRALALIRRARAKLAAGDILSIDDLATLTRETLMMKLSTAEELKDILAPFQQRHLTPQEEAGLQKLKEWASAQPDDVKQSMQLMKQLLEEAKTLMSSGDAATPAARDFAMRFRAAGRHLKNNAPPSLTDLKPKLKAMMDDARSDTGASRNLTVFAFIEKALASLKAQEENAASAE